MFIIPKIVDVCIKQYVLFITIATFPLHLFIVLNHKIHNNLIISLAGIEKFVTYNSSARMSCSNMTISAAYDSLT